ncbi:class I SAM-dependent methyltransferase [Thermomonospora catenispora]|uniref:class I SAM-dependent methyltransferase n=1 Tax=Thermomonospora catenispora TaxID=2493090 RepID=UPI00111F6940|nr:SAM-dependent methyltransferase [Thermomonospora catenispora]TNY38756.1 SAM-dependent methyltransferase [Thermomonospora catenispora]
MDEAGFRRLLEAEGQAVLAEAGRGDRTERGILATASGLRERYPAELVATALTQLRLRERAREKFGDDAARMYFTRAGLEQATRRCVAEYRARRFAGLLTEGERVLEPGCGIGADLIARARAGCRGDGVDADPLTAAVAQANVAALGLQELVTVRRGDAAALDPSGYAAVFADPGRRTARGRVFDPDAYEPPLRLVLELAGRVRAGCVKVAPGIPHESLPDGAEAEWISVNGEVKEAALWLGELAGPVRRRATLLDGRGREWTLTPDPAAEGAPVREWGRYLYEPDGAVIRAHLVAEVAAIVDGGLVDERIAYLTADALTATPFARAYEIDEVMPFSVKRLRAELRRRAPGALTIKKRGSAVDVERLRRELGFGGSRRGGRGGAGELTVVLTRIGAAPVAVLARPAGPQFR